MFFLRLLESFFDPWAEYFKRILFKNLSKDFYKFNNEG